MFEFNLPLIAPNGVDVENKIEPVAMAEWVVRQTAGQEVSSSNPSIPPLLKHACGEGD